MAYLRTRNSANHEPPKRIRAMYDALNEYEAKTGFPLPGFALSMPPHAVTSYVKAALGQRDLVRGSIEGRWGAHQRECIIGAVSAIYNERYIPQGNITRDDLELLQWMYRIDSEAVLSVPAISDHAGAALIDLSHNPMIARILSKEDMDRFASKLVTHTIIYHDNKTALSGFDEELTEDCIRAIQRVLKTIERPLTPAEMGEIVANTGLVEHREPLEHPLISAALSTPDAWMEKGAGMAEKQTSTRGGVRPRR